MADVLDELETGKISEPIVGSGKDILSELEPETAVTPSVMPAEEGFQLPPVASELISAINRGGVNLLEFLTTDQINAIMELAGSKQRVPNLSELPFVREAIAPGAMEPGLPRDIVRTGGEMMAPGAAGGQFFRSAAAMMPAAQTMTANIVRQLSQTTAPGDVAYSAIAGVGSAVGQEVGGQEGAMLGAIFAPAAASATQAGVKGLISAGKRGIELLMNSTKGMSEDGAAKLLAEAMVREGLSPEDVIRQLDELGPEAIPADLGTNFARLLRTASNKIPRIEGQAAEVFNARQAGQASRIYSAVDDATGTSGLTIDDEIIRLNEVLSPQIRDLYKRAGGQSLQLSERLRTLFKGKNSLGRARQRAERRLADKRAAGDQITHIDVVDATKQELDDQIGTAIRQGENNKARDLVRLKNLMVEEADESIPVYREARNLFAGKASLENAAESGQMFFKMKPRDMQELTQSMGESERRMFRLGAKQAILDKMNDLQTNADTVRRLFGRRGDVEKLKYLFDNDEAFNRFRDTLQRESQFILTRRAAQANSTTAKQLADEVSAHEHLTNAAQAIESPLGAANVLGRVVRGLSTKKGGEEFTEALETVGDILLSRGMKPEKIQSLLRRGRAEEIERVFRNAIQDELSAPSFTVPAAIGVAKEEE